MMQKGWSGVAEIKSRPWPRKAACILHLCHAQGQPGTVQFGEATMNYATWL